MPKSLRYNLEYRRAALEYGRASTENAEALWSACARDPLFWLNTFVWTYDPRPAVPDSPRRHLNTAVVPFITWRFQDDAFLSILDAIAIGYDLLIEKSRDMGASWLSILAFLYRWWFIDYQSFLMASRKEELVDKTGDLSALMPKLDLVLKMAPGWLVPDYERNRLHLRNLENGSVIDGESTNSDLGRGGRDTALLLDEFAAVEDGYAVLHSTRDTARCRIFNSTPQGASNAFYDKAHSDMKKLTLHWTLHPEKARGRYTGSDGRPKSPWYDEQCRRAVNAREIAQELDIDYTGSDYQFFPNETLDLLRSRIRPPLYAGDLEFDHQTLEPIHFRDVENGPMRMWFHPEASGKPPDDTRYVVGADVATGSRDLEGRGASNSALTVADVRTGEVVAMYVIHGLEAHLFARVAVSLCRWFRGCDGLGAFLIWEDNGPGMVFRAAVLEHDYRNIYYREVESSIRRPRTDKPGYWTTQDTKVALLKGYQSMLQKGDFVNPDIETYRELRMYVYTANGVVTHSRAAHTTDPTGARHNHADRVVSQALCALAIQQLRGRGVSGEELRIREELARPKPGSMAFRRQERMRLNRLQPHERRRRERERWPLTISRAG